jgi:GSCFA family
MEFQTPIHIKPLEQPVQYTDKLLLVGSCFTEHIGNALLDLKFSVLQNPNGILFDPYSVAHSLVSYIQPLLYTPEDLVLLDELWQSWRHHSQFADMNQEACLQKINASQNEAHLFLREADWIIITLGSSFSYRLVSSGMPVANCHRAPAQSFQKHLMTIEEINSVLDNCLHQLFHFNPKLRVLFTVSPVRHLRDGVVDNNRSKARLIEVVHHLVNKFDKLYYFPAYELVVDVLRDYRFYDVDMAHPNYQATNFVLDKFTQNYIEPAALPIMEAVRKLVTARRHKPFQPHTQAHRQFLDAQYSSANKLMQQYPFLDLREELAYFKGVNGG